MRFTRGIDENPAVFMVLKDAKSDYKMGVIVSQPSGRSSSSPTMSSLLMDILISPSLIRPSELQIPTQSDVRVD